MPSDDQLTSLPADSEVNLEPRRFEPPPPREKPVLDDAGWRCGDMRLAGQSEAIRDLHRRASELAFGRQPLLVTGSAGTGKYALAHMIHSASEYDPEVFVAVHCARQSPEETRDILFGKPVPDDQPFGTRLFAEVQPAAWLQARGGTLLLMFVEYLDRDTQDEIARAALEGFTRDKDHVPRGGLRLMLTSMWSYEHLVRFRKLTGELALLLRRNHLHIPLLRERADDIEPLVDAFLARHATADHPRKPLADGVLDKLRAHDWPGNLRELEAACRQALHDSAAEHFTAADFLSILRSAAPGPRDA